MHFVFIKHSPPTKETKDFQYTTTTTNDVISVHFQVCNQTPGNNQFCLKSESMTYAYFLGRLKSVTLVFEALCNLRTKGTAEKN